MIRTDRHMHFTLVEQAERDQATRDEVRRILGGASSGQRGEPSDDALGAARGCVRAVVWGLVAWAVMGTVALLIGAGA